MNTVPFVNATIGFSENLFLVKYNKYNNYEHQLIHKVYFTKFLGLFKPIPIRLPQITVLTSTLQKQN